MEDKKKIKVDLSEEDLSDLLNGEVFNWEFDGVEVELFKSNGENNE